MVYYYLLFLMNFINYHIIKNLLYDNLLLMEFIIIKFESNQFNQNFLILFYYYCYY